MLLPHRVKLAGEITETTVNVSDARRVADNLGAREQEAPPQAIVICAEDHKVSRGRLMRARYGTEGCEGAAARACANSNHDVCVSVEKGVAQFIWADVQAPRKWPIEKAIDPDVDSVWTAVLPRPQRLIFDGVLVRGGAAGAYRYKLRAVCVRASVVIKANPRTVYGDRVAGQRAADDVPAPGVSPALLHPRESSRPRAGARRNHHHSHTDSHPLNLARAAP